MPDDKKLCVVIAGLTLPALLFCWGCQQKISAVDLYLDGIVLTEYDQDAKAVQKLQEAVKVDKKFWYAYSVLGQVYEKMEDYPNSAASYEKATKINPDSFKDFFSLGRVYRMMKELTKAGDAYVRACEIDPNHLQAHLSAAKCYMELENYGSALKFGERARALDPKVADVQMLLG